MASIGQSPMTTNVLCRWKPLLPLVVTLQALVIVWLSTGVGRGYWCTRVIVPVSRKTPQGIPPTNFSLPLLPTPSTPGRIFYNRVPKCGSSSLLDLIRVSSHLNNFTFVECATYMTFVVDQRQAERMAAQVNKVAAPMVFERHVHFINFKKLGMVPEPVYVNVVRDPVDRLESWYYYRRFQVGHMRNMSTADKNRTYDECVLGNFSECVDPLGDEAEIGYFKLIPFFCGQEEFCRTPGEAALSEAIQNVKRHYAVIGLVEMYPQFIQTLEAMFPTYFKGITAIYTDLGETIHEHYKTSNRKRASAQVREVMATRLEDEYQLYYYLKRRFVRLYNRLMLFKTKNDVTFI